jgi:virginiamycin B lyase
MSITAMTLLARRRLQLAIVAAVAVSLLIAGGLLLTRGSAPDARFVEYRMPSPQEGPMAIAAAADGTIWFTIDQAKAIGRIRGGRIERLATPGRNFEPLGLAVAADGSAWYTDIEARAIMRINPEGEISRFAIDSAIVRLGRLAIGGDGSVWFADTADTGVTQLRNGAFIQHELGSAGAGPYGVVVNTDGIVWATLQSNSKLVSIEPNGRIATIDLPRAGAVPTDIAIAADGALWFLQFRGNRVGRFKDGTFSEFEVGEQIAGLSGLAVAGDGAVWFGMVRQSSLGRLRDGRLVTFRLPRDGARPYSLAVDPDGNIWYADISGYVGMLPVRYARAQ